MIVITYTLFIFEALNIKIEEIYQVSFGQKTTF